MAVGSWQQLQRTGVYQHRLNDKVQEIPYKNHPNMTKEFYNQVVFVSFFW